jgi:hypothetical protein
MRETIEFVNVAELDSTDCVETSGGFGAYPGYNVKEHQKANSLFGSFLHGFWDGFFS